MCLIWILLLRKKWKSSDKTKKIEEQEQLKGKKISNEDAYQNLLPHSCNARAGMAHKSFEGQVFTKNLIILWPKL